MASVIFTSRSPSSYCFGFMAYEYCRLMLRCWISGCTIQENKKSGICRCHSKKSIREDFEKGIDNSSNKHWQIQIIINRVFVGDLVLVEWFTMVRGLFPVQLSGSIIAASNGFFFFSNRILTCETRPEALVACGSDNIKELLSCLLTTAGYCIFQKVPHILESTCNLQRICLEKSH